MLLRYAYIASPGFVFQFFKHTHSHVAFLGWVFNALFLLIIHAYFKEVSAKIKWQFYLLQLSILGMLFSFPFQGYAPVSIAFSTLHVIISIWFYFSTITAIKAEVPSVKWVKLGAFFMVISNLGPLALAPILMSDLKDSFVYHLSLQHYLHFQYNGWFIVAALGLLIHFFKLRLKYDRLLFWLLGWSVIPLFFISVAFIQSETLYYMIGGIGATAQVAGVVLLIKSIFNQFEGQSNLFKGLMSFVLLCLLSKSVFQLSVAFPYLSDAIVGAHNPVIGFLHLIFLGVISNLLVGLLIKTGYIRKGLLTGTGVVIFNFGFLAMELLLFAQLYQVPLNYFHWLFYSTVPIFIGVLIFNIEGYGRFTNGRK